jgi:HAD superfamily hydrolase (TIGR01549 family)
VPSIAARIHRRKTLSPILLLDLDDTLLQNNVDDFLPQYLGAFSKKAAAYLDPNRFIKSLLAGTQAMTDNRQPDCTLKESFEATFYPLTGVARESFEVLAEQFYAEVFPNLRGLTNPIPQSIQMVKDALERGYRLVVATNPLFPRTAILQRLAWANLPADQYSYEMITSYETFHFTKPDPTYYAEIMARMGWPSEPAVVVGDDLERDIYAGRRLGLPAYWIRQPGMAPANGGDAPTQEGKIEELIPWLDQVSPHILQAEYNSPIAWLAILRSTPAGLDSFCRFLKGFEWASRSQPDEWSLTEILCHLRDVDQEVNLPRLHKVLAETNPFLPGEDTDRWAEVRQYCFQDGPQALHQFIATRGELVSLLETLAVQDWQRPARHAIFGPTHLQELVSIITAHDRVHMGQVHELLKQVAPASLIQ